MATPFNQTVQSLAVDGLGRSRVGLAAVTIVLGAWFGWFLLADVGIYETAPAQLQVERDIHVVETTLEARVLTNYMAVGREVNAGDILVELDAAAVRLKRAEQQAKLDSARTQLRALEAEIAAEEQGLADVRGAAPVAQAESLRRYQQAQADARLADNELARWRLLYDKGVVAKPPVVEREITAQRRRSEVEELRLASEREGRDRRAGEADRRARIERLRGDAAELAGVIAATTEVVRQLEHETEHYRLRAPISGPLAEVADLQPGVIVRPGERLATIVPSGALKATADFPLTAVGRIRPEQPAWLRLDGFPWGQYGRVTASVQRVAHEPRSGKIRVEFAIPPSHISIPLQHGLPGSVEIEVERVSPAALALRAAGALARSAQAKEGE